jgi:putative addiction module CopG family antidote
LLFLAIHSILEIILIGDPLKASLMNVSLTPELEQYVHSKVKSGRYLSASEVVREALRLLEERDRLREIRLATL